MAVRHATYILTETPVLLDIINDSDNNLGMTIMFHTAKLNGQPVFIGGPTVTATDFGVHMDADDNVSFSGHFTYKDQFWARAKLNTATLHVLVAGA